MPPKHVTFAAMNTNPTPPFGPYHIILASGSPRRRQLLADAGLSFQVKVSNVDEDFPPDLPVAEVAAYLARRKARSIYDSEPIGEQDIILAADSTVVMGNAIYNKPENYAGAVQMLQALSGQQHQVITGVCLLSRHQEVVFSDIAEVYFDVLSPQDIEYYVRTFEPYDKAGAYGIQEWIGLCRVRRIEGTFSNIMGLPVPKVLEALRAFAPPPKDS